MIQHPLLTSSPPRQSSFLDEDEDDEEIALPFRPATSRRSSLSSHNSSATTATTTPRTHTVKPGDTVEGVSIAYGCSIADLKRLNGLLWPSDPIHLRRTLLIPDRIPKTLCEPWLPSLKHKVSEHPHNMGVVRPELCVKTWGDVAVGMRKGSGKGSLESQPPHTTPTTLMKTLRTLDSDVETICQTLIKPSPDKRPDNASPLQSWSLETIKVDIYLTLPGMAGGAANFASTKSKSPGLGPTLFPPPLLPCLDPLSIGTDTVPTIALDASPPSSASPNLHVYAPRSQWRVIVQLKEPIAATLGEGVRKVIESDVSGRILRRL
ncbi:hypothetical protein HDU98_002087 [Podochytrium sp. JEL0797]|nr:hypothetical protein HDU98_002087 [Podochytrium sp. JEL0797]